ncbi:non-heme iron oxygenase ferredoxin subunit [Streptomyces sp. NBC_00247]|uniref:non-heme iron oxygenase ferredoxin subunit n=1 Tax=Streptomyces sp. NBC_00247 TaxID=2975689 RepID=UPI002E288968|nr:non-heme iron oxygenase ferredoxin subunit [Streptomyces sp. NBC_00247]
MSQSYVRACALADVPEEGVLGVDVEGSQVAVVRSGGEVHALEDRCSHSDVPLSEGEVYDGVIECWLHGSCFDLRTGNADCNPATKAVRVYSTKVEDDSIFVSLQPDRQGVPR